MRENVDDQAPLRITVIKENPLANYDDYVPNKLPFLRSLPLVQNITKIKLYFIFLKY